MSDKSTPRTGKEKLALMQAEQARKSRQNKLLAILSGCVVIVLVAVGIAWAVAGQNKSSQDKQAQQQARSNAFIGTVTSIPAASFAAVGAGTASNPPQKMSSPKAETKDGKPVITYVGAEFCPFCGMERWALVAAMSRFGTFTGLQGAVSASDDSPSNIPTMTFLHATYTSKYIVFTTYETQDRNHNPLQTPPSSVTNIMTRDDPNGSIPYIDYGGLFFSNGATYQDASLSNMSASAVAAQLKNPSSAIAKNILGAANVLSAQVCQLTHGQPANVCKAKGVIAAAGSLGQ